MSTHATPEIIILPAPNCRRSQKVLDYLTNRGIPFTRIPLESPEGQDIAERYHLRSSPGIIVDGEMVNPFDILIQPVCRIDEAELYRRFHLSPPSANELDSRLGSRLDSRTDSE